MEKDKPYLQNYLKNIESSSKICKYKRITLSPLRYPGGKTRACKTLDTILKDHFDVSKFD